MASCHHHVPNYMRTATLHYAKASQYHHQRQSSSSLTNKDNCSNADGFKNGEEGLCIPQILCSSAALLGYIRRGADRRDLSVAPTIFRNYSAAGLSRRGDNIVNTTTNLHCSPGPGQVAERWGWKARSDYHSHIYSNRRRCNGGLVDSGLSFGSLCAGGFIRRGLIGKQVMSMSLLLDPIIGSPPSSLTSPSVEARDDISALSEGFARKVNVFRRRLSTSFDEPSTPEYGSRAVISGVSSGVVIEHEGPFGYRGGNIRGEKVSTVQDEDSLDKKAKLNAWLTKIHEEAILSGRENSGEGGSGSKGGSDGGSSSDHDDSRESPKPLSPARLKISEDLFQLLEKVIGFKGRNVSHITVEQSVKDLCTVYMDSTDEEKLKFFTALAEQYGVDHDSVTSIAVNLGACKDEDVRLTLEEKLRGALVPKSQWLFTQIGRLENGVKFLVDMRTDLLDTIEKSQGKSSLKALNNGVRDLIGMWFNVGFLNLERVTWQSSCEMLQKVSEYEAVHPMRNWTDLKKRVGPNRRCFVFTHNSMPGEPVVVLHTFLTDHIPSSIKKIVASHRMRMMSLDSDLPMASTAEDPEFINTAAFYSITSTQRGLTGIELGNYLIKRVVRELQSEFPKMTQYSSLSPIPGFQKWLISTIKNEMKGPSRKLFSEAEMNSLKPIFDTYSTDKDFYQVFLDLLKLNSWFSDKRLVKEFEKPLMRLCAQYLFVVKRRGYSLDPVAHFHLKNGAVLWRINWLGDESPRGLGQSCGMMVNYRYFLDACESNSQNYMENQVIHISDQVNHLVKLTPS